MKALGIRLDICMWSKDGPPEDVLAAIEREIGYYAHKKILVLNGGVSPKDLTYEKYGWQTVEEDWTKGVGGKANRALEEVDCSYFATFEDDVILARGWFDAVWAGMTRISGENGICVAGTRVATNPVLRAIDTTAARRMNVEENKAGEYISIDNNLWRTSAVIEIGGFSTDCPYAVDWYTRRKAIAHGMRWVILKEVVSDHKRDSIRSALGHSYYATKACLSAPSCRRGHYRLKVLRYFLTSPARGVIEAFRYRRPEIVIVYPLIRLQGLRGALAATKS